jgi:hypothetical protein
MEMKGAFLPGLIAVAILSACNNTPESMNASADLDAGVEGIYCKAVEQRVSPEDCEDLTHADAEVRPGAAAFNIPDPMKRGETVSVHLVIDRRSPKEIRIIEERPKDVSPVPEGNVATGAPDTNASAESPDANGAAETQVPSPDVPEPAPTPGQIVDRLEGTPDLFFPPVGRHMRAELIGQGFDINAKSESSQEIPLGGQASWVWEVTARRGGNQSLTLVTIVEGVANGRRFPLAKTPKVRTVVVEVSIPDRIRDTLAEAPGWIKALTAILLALGGLFAAWRKLWSRGRSESTSDEIQNSPGSDGSGLSE